MYYEMHHSDKPCIEDHQHEDGFHYENEKLYPHCAHCNERAWMVKVPRACTLQTSLDEANAKLEAAMKVVEAAQIVDGLTVESPDSPIRRKWYGADHSPSLFDLRTALAELDAIPKGGE